MIFVANRSQIQRIKYYELLLDRLTDTVNDLDRAIAAFEDAEPMIKELSDYYGGRQWKKDFADDEAGLLPKDLKRGVLSEDAVYDLLDRIGELIERLE